MDRHTPVLSLTIGISGHRDIDECKYEELKRAFSAYLKSLHEDFPALTLRVLSGLAIGADTACIDAAIALQDKGLPVVPVAVLPRPEPDYCTDFSDIELTCFHEKLAYIREHGEIIELPATDINRESYVHLAHYLTIKSDLIFAAWNGVFNDKPGGTGYVVKRVLKPEVRIKEAHNIAAPQRQASIMNSWFHDVDSIPVYVHPVRRLSAHEERCILKKPGYAHFDSDDNLVVQPSMITEHKTRFTRLNDMFRDNVALIPDNESLLRRLVGDNNITGFNTPDLQNLARLYHCFSDRAKHHTKKVANFKKSVVYSTLFMALSFLIFAKLAPLKIFLLAYFVIFSVGSFYFVMTNPNRFQAEHALMRLIAESLRIEFFKRASGAVDPIGYNSLSMTIASYGMKDIDIVRAVLKQASRLGGEDRPVAPELIVRAWLTSQAQYYKKASSKKHSQHERDEYWLKVTIAVPIMISAILLIFGDTYKQEAVYGLDYKTILVFFMGFVPVLGALTELQARFDANKELFHQYKTTLDYLNNAIKALSSSKDAEFLNLLNIVSAELSGEHVRWAVMTQQKHLDPPNAG